jgi:excisionase family DNA binding protein
MAGEPSKYMTVRELAEFLRIKERRVYSLAAAGEIPFIRATRKLLFPRDEVEAWMARRSTGRAGRGKAVDRPAVLVGSHDPLLEWALRESRSGIATFFDGSIDGLRRLRDGEAIAGGIHLFEPDDETWNARHVTETLPDAPVVLLEWAWRERGLIVAPDAQESIKGLHDLVGRRLVPRQPEAGSQVLFQALLAKQDIDAQAIDQSQPPARNESDVAIIIADGKAEAGFGLAGVARQFRLGFVPIMRERYDLVVFRRPYFLEPFQRLLHFCRTPAFADRAQEMGGYDVSDLGHVHYVGP